MGLPEKGNSTPGKPEGIARGLGLDLLRDFLLRQLQRYTTNIYYGLPEAMIHAHSET